MLMAKFFRKENIVRVGINVSAFLMDYNTLSQKVLNVVPLFPHKNIVLFSSLPMYLLV